MDAAALRQDLLHTVDVSYETGVDTFGERTMAFAERVPCLVDAASGRRERRDSTGSMASFDFAVSFGPKAPVTLGAILEDARDRQGVQLFARGAVEALQRYQDPLYGLQGFLAFVRSREAT